jgi:hypothetical protein
MLIAELDMSQGMSLLPASQLFILSLFQREVVWKESRDTFFKDYQILKNNHQIPKRDILKKENISESNFTIENNHTHTHKRRSKEKASHFFTISLEPGCTHILCSVYL